LKNEKERGMSEKMRNFAAEKEQTHQYTSLWSTTKLEKPG
jgi:hypothetical protein